MTYQDRNCLPFFSIIIPTKNRAHIVGFAVQSVLNQSFTNFEIVLIDNDDTDATSNILGSFDDTRIRYIRTGGLSMVQNWRRGFAETKGKYLSVLEDKHALYPDALARIHQAIDDTMLDVVAWGTDVFNDKKNIAFTLSDNKSEHYSLVSSQDLLNCYIKNPNEIFERMPRLINSCISRKLINEIGLKFNGDGFIRDFSPDACAAILTLSSADSLIYLNRPCGIEGYRNLSNALKWMRGDSKFMGFNSIVFDPEVGIKNQRLIHNTVYNDYVRVMRSNKMQSTFPRMNPNVYAVLCARDAGRLPFGNLHAINDVLKYANSNNVSRIRVFVQFLSSFIKGWLIHNIGRHHFQAKKKWRADNILQAVSSNKT